MTSENTARRSRGWKALAKIIVGASVLLAPVFFIVMYLTVTHLVRPSFSGWAWTVPVGTEGCFVILYLLDILLEWADKPMGWLRFMPYPFATASLWLNVYAAHGNLPGMVGHGVITVAFFLPLIAGEAAVRSLARTDKQIAVKQAMSDARRYALDLVRATKGPFWRFRIPTLLKRQLLRTRFPDGVRAAVAECAVSGGWQKEVRDWVLGPDGLNITEQARADSERARDAIRSAPETAPEAAPEIALEAAPEAPPQVVSQPVSKTARPATPSGPRKPSASAVKRMTGEDLAPYVGVLLEDDPKLTPSDLMKTLKIGRIKADEALRAAREQSRGAAVIAIGARS